MPVLHASTLPKYIPPICIHSFQRLGYFDLLPPPLSYAADCAHCCPALSFPLSSHPSSRLPAVRHTFSPFNIYTPNLSRFHSLLFHLISRSLRPPSFSSPPFLYTHVLHRYIIRAASPSPLAPFLSYLLRSPFPPPLFSSPVLIALVLSFPSSSQPPRFFFGTPVCRLSLSSPHPPSHLPPIRIPWGADADAHATADASHQPAPLELEITAIRDSTTHRDTISPQSPGSYRFPDA
ncbi:hypothetical protein C8J57DRAFT_1727492 [Mycena rebaudengoi]|nr:hypothetical protein C8J57DRAFT_1727492 [Mycena rebaudengoi]